MLQVCDTYPPEGGGLGAHVERVARQLDARGHEVMVVTATPAEGEPDGDFPVHRLGVSLARIPGAYEPTSPPFHPPWPDPAFRRGLHDAAAAFRPDVVHAHGWCVHSTLGRGPEWTRRVVATLHDYNLSCPKKSLLRFDRECETGRGPACLRCDDQTLPKRVGLAAALAATTPVLKRRIRRLLAVSGHVARRAEAAGIRPGLIEVVPNFVDLPADADRGRGDGATPPPYVMYAGPAAPHKGRQVLIEAFRGLERDVLLRLVGGDGTASEPGIEDVGYKSGTELARLYRQALLVVVPSIWADPCPTVALEAMANGRPVVASAGGGLPEIVEDGVTGLLVPPGDPVALRTAIVRLLDEPARREEMGARGHERVTRFSTETVLPRLEAIYAEEAGR